MLYHDVRIGHGIIRWWHAVHVLFVQSTVIGSLCICYIPTKGCWSGFYGTSDCVCLNPWVAVSPCIVCDMICSWCVHDMFMHVEWYSPDWIFHHMFVTCCACIVWPGIFPTRGCWNGFYGTIETGIITVSATCVVSQANSAIVHVMFMLYCPV